MKTQLLCTFTTKDSFEDVVEQIKSEYTIVFNKIYVLQNEDNINELICTYNVDFENSVDYNKVKGTISLHRKKHSNTLYTINALNEVIANIHPLRGILISLLILSSVTETLTPPIIFSCNCTTAVLL